MTHKELLYVKTIAEEKSISKAAKKLYISQPSLSQAIQRIESSLGTVLFKRTSSGLLLTFAGEKYCKMAGQVLKMYEDFKLEVSDINDMRTGKINLGITTHLSVYVLPLVIPKFKEICPFIDIYVIEKNSTELEKSLLSGEIDFAIMHEPKSKKNVAIDYESLVNDPFLLAMSKDHPLAKHGKKVSNQEYPYIDLELFRNSDFVMLNKEQRIRHISDNILSLANIHPNIVLTVKNFEAAKRLASQGLGITFIPLQYSKLASQEFPPTYFMLDKKYEASWIMCIATLKNSFLSKADNIFLEIVRDKFSSV
ncbi:LysR family transcriptional regulator [Romboutsia ilealis]|uniref:LysR family transcriptional regulator n=1 Tax=Romboutsia faecis TaxID=2764597 RepID=A0ABR7JQH2_9FIRM|nr:LysR family transcriptional regulator [Romboutsia faecis]MBC5997168.1 LysR family transcriptional regulator [Romboutsia faecis]MRN23450.1 LysR family transcriptional regulator [Romboutsia ilealis]